jgi:diguanylate cyclase/phosphodiesterase with PAS/PAC sensor(s)
MEVNGEGAIILDSIVSLGHALGLTVTAEGVEYEEQVRFLQQLRCDEMQGYYFAPPLSADEVDRRLSMEVWRGDNATPAQSKSAA